MSRSNADARDAAVEFIKAIANDLWAMHENETGPVQDALGYLTRRQVDTLKREARDLLLRHAVALAQEHISD